MASKCGLCSVLTDVFDSCNDLIDQVCNLAIYCVDKGDQNYFKAKHDWLID